MPDHPPEPSAEGSAAATPSLDSLLQSLCRRPAAEAIAEVRVLLRARPDDPDLLAVLGILRAGQGAVAEALDCLETAHYLRPADAALLYRYGEVLERAGRPREARRRYQGVLGLEAGHPGASARLAALSEPRTAPRRAPPPTAPDDVPEPEPEPAPGFLSLARGLLILWSLWPLVWLGLPALPLAAVALVTPRGHESNWEAAVHWLVALSVGLPPLAALMARETRPPPETPRRNLAWVLTLPLTALYLGLVVAPFCYLAAARTRLEGWVLVLLTLALTLPVHVLAGPGFVRACAGDASPLRAALQGLRLASPRLWLHLALAATAAGLAAGVLALGAAGAAEAAQGLGWGVTRALEVLALAGAAALGTAVLVVCAVDLEPPPPAGDRR